MSASMSIRAVSMELERLNEMLRVPDGAAPAAAASRRAPIAPELQTTDGNHYRSGARVAAFHTLDERYLLSPGPPPPDVAARPLRELSPPREGRRRPVLDEPDFATPRLTPAPEGASRTAYHAPPPSGAMAAAAAAAAAAGVSSSSASRGGGGRSQLYRHAAAAYAVRGGGRSVAARGGQEHQHQISEQTASLVSQLAALEQKFRVDAANDGAARHRQRAVAAAAATRSDGWADTRQSGTRRSPIAPAARQERALAGNNADPRPRRGGANGNEVSPHVASRSPPTVEQRQRQHPPLPRPAFYDAQQAQQRWWAYEPVSDASEARVVDSVRGILTGAASATDNASTAVRADEPQSKDSLAVAVVPPPPPPTSPPSSTLVAVQQQQQQLVTTQSALALTDIADAAAARAITALTPMLKANEVRPYLRRSHV